MMIGWDILNKDNSFSFFFKLFRPLRSFCLFVCPPFVSANLAPSIFFARPCPFFRRLWSCFPLRPPLLSPPLLHPQIFKLFPPCLPFSARAELLFSFSLRPHCSPPLFLRPSPALPASPVPPASPAPPAQPFPPLFFCPPRPSFLPPPFRPVLSPLSLFPERFAPFPPPGRRRPQRAADDW